MNDEYPIYLAGKWTRTERELPVIFPYDGAKVATTWLAGEREFEVAAAAAVEAAPVMAAVPAFERAAILRRAAAEMRTRREEIGRTLTLECGKPIREALTEVDRGVMTFQVAADEATRIGGEAIPMDLAPHGRGRVAITRRFPLGPVAAISPFNFPFNLAAHKLAPAVAAGDPIVLKPASKTPLSALALAQALDRAGLPPGGLSVLPMDRALGDRLVTDERFKLLSFTGSSAVGWAMKARAGKKRVLLELGGNAGVIVDETADLDYAVRRIVVGGFAVAGQSCISVQRVFLHRTVFDEFAAKLAARVSTIRVGDPRDPETELGPMIEEAEAARVDAWVKEAEAGGARVLVGGQRTGRALYAPTVVTGAPPSSRLCVQEVFAPLVVLFPFTDFRAALDEVNRSSYGLQAGVFTNDLERSLMAFDLLAVGGVIVNDVSAYRIDHMPYGGTKDSGIGKEGPRYAIEEMTEVKLLVVNRDRG